MSYYSCKSPYEFADDQQTYFMSRRNHSSNAGGVDSKNISTKEKKKEPYDFFKNQTGASSEDIKSLYDISITFINLILHGISYRRW